VTSGSVDDGGSSTGDATRGGTGGSSGSGDSGGDPLQDWTKRRPLVVGNLLPGDLVDTQVPVTIVYDADMDVGFDDLRITDELGVPLPFWVDNVTPAVSAELWVRVPLVPGAGSTNLYAYYGNLAAPSASDGAATFLFFEDFESGVLDPLVWDSNGTSSIVNGRLVIETGAVYTTDLVINGPSQAAEFFVTSYDLMSGEPASGCVAVGATTAPGVLGSPWARLLPMNDPPLQVSFDGESIAFSGVPMPPTGSASPRHFAIAVHGGAVLFDHDRGTNTYGVPGDWVNPMFLWIGHFDGSTGLDDLADLEIEDVVVRRYVDAFPTAIVGAEEDT
jgi:hypothetical protein